MNRVPCPVFRLRATEDGERITEDGLLQNEMKICVLAIGGNSLIKKDKISFADQYETLKETVKGICDLVEKGYEVIVTHGNGPQVGFLLLRSHLSRNRLPEIPLDACNALTQAEIGYMIQLALRNEFKKSGIEKPVVTVVTQVLVDKNDPAFINPTKPIGPFYTKREAHTLTKELGWIIKEDSGRGYRRFVPSPEPKEILEYEEILALVKNGTVVIAAGGGGIPVNYENGDLKPVSAVIDKDLTSSLLAQKVNAELFLISTGVPQVYLNYNKPNQKPLESLTVKEANQYLKSGEFPLGSMGPKIQASIEFLEKSETKRMVIITSPENIGLALENKAGTRIHL